MAASSTSGRLGYLAWLSLFLCAVASASDPHSVAIIDRCETIEVNSVFNEDGVLTFQQFIFRDPDAIVDWRIRKPEMALWRSPSGLWSLSWWDGSHLRQVRAIRVVETHTQYDPELFEREAFPVEFRRRLSEPLRVERSVLRQ